MSAEIIITNAKLRTMDASAPRAEALAIEGNRIIAVGSAQEIAALQGEGTRVIDAGGATVIPGFNDAHAHLFPGSVFLERPNLAPVRGVEALREVLLDYAARTPGDDLLCAECVDYAVLGDGVPLTRQVLDSIIADRPVLLTAADGHTAWANTAALEAAGLLHGREVGVGNEVVMAEDGTAMGELREGEAIEPVSGLSALDTRMGLGMRTGGEPEGVTPEDREADKAMLLNGMRYCAARGITSLQNMDGNLYQLELLEEIEAEQGLPIRVRIPFHCKNNTPLDEITSRAAAWRERFPGDRLKSDFMKVFIDGVIDSATACMIEEYADQPGWKGEPLFTQEALNAAVTEADRQGFQVAIHSIGDAGVRMTLDAYKAAAEANGARDARHRVEHIEVIHPDDIARFKEQGVMASMQPLHVPGSGGFDLGGYPDKLGEGRWPYAFPIRDLLEAGAELVLSTDWPVVPVEPMLSVQEAVIRKPWLQGLPDQSLTLDETLRAYTLGGAYAEFMEDRKGMLKPGYLADVVVLSDDLDAVASTDLAGVTPKVTICDGEITYEA